MAEEDKGSGGPARGRVRAAPLMNSIGLTSGPAGGKGGMGGARLAGWRERGGPSRGMGCGREPGNAEWWWRWGMWGCATLGNGFHDKKYRGKGVPCHKNTVENEGCGHKFEVPRHAVALRNVAERGTHGQGARFYAKRRAGVPAGRELIRRCLPGVE